MQENFPGKIKLTILVDASTVEIFVNDGEHTLSNIIFPKLTSDEIKLWTDNHVYLDYLKIRNNDINRINLYIFEDILRLLINLM